MKNALLVIFSFSFFTLPACEGFIHIQGKAYDNTTKNPIENVKVALVFREKDTMWANKLKYYDERGRSIFQPSITDSGGNFKVGTVLIGCVPKCPTYELVFIKEGYIPYKVKSKTLQQDSLKVFLETVVK
jgi:hypothetical protein